MSLNKKEFKRAIELQESIKKIEFAINTKYTVMGSISVLSKDLQEMFPKDDPMIITNKMFHDFQNAIIENMTNRLKVLKVEYETLITNE